MTLRGPDHFHTHTHTDICKRVDSSNCISPFPHSLFSLSFYSCLLAIVYSVQVSVTEFKCPLIVLQLLHIVLTYAILAAASRRQSRAEGVASRQQSAFLVILTVRSANMWLRYPRVTQYVNPMQ